MGEFWREKNLEEMSREEWESLCDGCARCCLLKTYDQADRVRYTAVHCRYLDIKHCQCSDYGRRTQLVEGCVRLTPAFVRETDWLPDTCAYRLLAEGKDLPTWHPLRSGDINSVFAAEISIRGKTLSEDAVHPDSVADMVITWVAA